MSGDLAKSSPYSVRGQPEADAVQALFAAIASRYDLINDLQSLGLHRRWKRRVADLASVRPGDQALDVCCGTGDIALELATRGAQVVGLDLCRPMLDIAERRRDRGTRSGRPGPRGDALRFIQADALHLPFPDSSFDVVTAGYGLRNLADWRRGLAEMHRVARPGGRLIVLDFGRPANPVWRAVYMAYLRSVVPLLGLAACGNRRAYAYIHQSLRRYPAQQGLEDAMREIGLVKVSTVNLLGGAMTITRAKKTGT